MEQAVGTERTPAEQIRAAAIEHGWRPTALDNLNDTELRRGCLRIKIAWTASGEVGNASLRPHQAMPTGHCWGSGTTEAVLSWIERPDDCCTGPE